MGYRISPAPRLPASFGVPAPKVSLVLRRLLQTPDWLVGLLLAIVVTVVLLVVFGAGDDPTLGG
jgi:hypothetical protein